MANHKSFQAVDIAEIYEYGIFTFGLNQSQSYLNGLEEKPWVQVSKKESSRKVASNSQSHIIFFTLTENTDFVVWILGRHRDFHRHF